MPIIIISIMILLPIIIRNRAKRRRMRRPSRRCPVRSVSVRTGQLTAAQLERAAQAAARQAAAERKKSFQKRQAVDDIEHYSEQQREILKLYDADKAIFNDPGKTVAARRAAYKRIIGHNERIRTYQRKIDKAQYIIAEP